MSTSTPPRPAVRSAFERLIDYAGLFPPAKLDMEPAIAEYARARAGAQAWMLGRFIVPASRLDEMASQAEPLSLCAIVDADLDPRRWFASAQASLASIARVRTANGPLRIEVIEAQLPALATARDTFDATIGQFSVLAEQAGLRDLPMYVELPRSDRWPELLPGSMAALARAHLRAKLRCGGVAAQAFPSVAEVAAFIVAAGAEEVPFKATAGLHHPVRHRHADTGFVMHGFLNLLAAAAFSQRVDPATIEAIVAEEEATAFTFDEVGLRWRAQRATGSDLEAVRERGFVSYGSCSFSEPVEDLTSLSILS